MGKLFSCAPNKIVVKSIDLGNDNYINVNGVIQENKLGKALEKARVLVVGKNVDFVNVGDTVTIGLHAGFLFASDTLEGELEAYKSVHDYEICLVEREVQE